jgi:hypothetical protein
MKKQQQKNKTQKRKTVIKGGVWNFFGLFGNDKKENSVVQASSGQPPVVPAVPAVPTESNPQETKGGKRSKKNKSKKSKKSKK